MTLLNDIFQYTSLNGRATVVRQKVIIHNGYLWTQDVVWSICREGWFIGIDGDREKYRGREKKRGRKKNRETGKFVSMAWLDDIYIYIYIYIYVGLLPLFNGISTFVGYLIPKLFSNTNIEVLFIAGRKRGLITFPRVFVRKYIYIYTLKHIYIYILYICMYI